MPGLGGCALFGSSDLLDTAEEPLGIPLRIRVRDPDSERAAEATAAAFREARRVGKLLLARRRTSNFGVLNYLGPGTWLKVAPETMAIGTSAIQIQEITSGAYTPVRHLLLDAWGLPAGKPRVPTQREIDAAVLQASKKYLELDSKNQMARRVGPESFIDLEGVAIGGMVDAAMHLLERMGVPAAHVQSGRISHVYSALGDEPWSLDVFALDEHDHPRAIARVKLRNGGFAAVHRGEVFVAEDGTQIHEWIDPRSGRPVAGVFAAAVRAEQASVAAGLAAAAMVLGDETRSVLKNRPGLQWLLVTEAGGKTHSLGLTVDWLEN